MATNEEILRSRLLGYVKKNPDNNNARISIVGYMDSESKEYVALEANRAQAIFPQTGKLYAPGFDFGRYGLPDSFIGCKAERNKDEASSSLGKDKYAVSYNSERPVSVSVRRIITVTYKTSLESGFIAQDEISRFIGSTDIPSIQGFFYLRYGNRLYGLFRYDSLKKTIIPSDGTTVFAYEMNPVGRINFENKEYFIRSESSLKRVSVVDCMDSDQLADWFKNLLRSEVGLERFRSITMEEFRNFTKYFNENDEPLNKKRLERIEGKVHALNWTYDEMKKLLNSDSDLTTNLRNSLQQMKGDFQLEWARELESEKEKLQQEIDSLSVEKESLQKSIDEFPSKKEEMAAELSKLEEKYLEQDDMIQKSLLEMEEKRDSLKAELKELETRKRDIITVAPIVFPAVGNSFTYLEEKKGFTFVSLMKENIGEKALPKVLFDQLADTGNTLASCQACFIPSVSWAYYYAKGIRNAKLYMMHVEHDWLHYKDFLKNGLLDVLESCDENASVNHILVFDSLNLTQPECGLKPLLDVISGYALVIPAFDKLMPRNLKIFATILPFSGENKIGLPLRSDSFSNWGQVAKPEDKLPLPSYFLQNLDSTDGFFKGRKDINMSGYSLQNLDPAKGFFEPKDICNKWKSNLKQENNGYFAD